MAQEEGQHTLADASEPEDTNAAGKIGVRFDHFLK
jgi:hypothetical protein